MRTTEELSFEFVVIGGGMAGICAAVSAARRGVKTCLVHDRAVLGGNASSEIRMWIRGASIKFPLYREGGILEEIALLNEKYNPEMNYSIWDGILWDLVKKEKNLTLMANTVCTGAEYEGDRVSAIRALGLTNYREFCIRADYFADCSGDCVLADFLPVKTRIGREGKNEYNESAAISQADDCTMGNGVLIQVREADHPVRFTPPTFARKLTDDDFKNRLNIKDRYGFLKTNFWWIELAYGRKTLEEAEATKDELLAIAYGTWDYIKNSGKFEAENWTLDFVGFYPAKRESRRYVGAYTLTQNDIDAATPFEDEIAYGGWPMDDHSPNDFDHGESPNVNHKVKAPYAIPYRCLYTEAFTNLAFAGRNISATHMAMSSTRVMATCGLMGHAVGAAVSLAKKHGVSFAGVLPYIGELKQRLRDDDCYLLYTPRQSSALICEAKCNLMEEKRGRLLSGIERSFEEDNTLRLAKGEELTFTFAAAYVGRIRLLFDSDIARACQPIRDLAMYPQIYAYPKDAPNAFVPPALVRAYTVTVVTEDGEILTFSEKENISRLVFLPIDRKITSITFVGEETYGAEDVRLFSLDITE